MSYNDRQGDDTVAEAEGAQRHAAPHATRPQPVEPPEPPPPPLLPSSPHHPQGSNNNNNIPQRSNNFFRGVHVIVSGSSRLPHLPPPPLQKRVQRYHWTQVAEQPTGWPCSGPGAGGSVPERLGSQLSWRLRDQVSQQLEMYLATAASVLLWCAAVWGSRQVASEQGPSGGFARRGAAMLSRYSRHSDQDVANPEPPSVVSVSAPAGVGGGGQGAGQPELLPLWLSAPAAGDVGGGGAGGSRDPPGPPPSLSAVYDSLPSPLYGECTGAKSAICTPPTPPSSTAALWPMTSGVIMPTAAAASKGDVEQLAASAVAAAVTAAEAAFGRRTGGSTSTPAIGTAAAVAPPPTTPTSRANVGPLLQGGGSSWPGRPPGVNVLYHSPLHRAALSLKLTELGGVDFEEGCTALQAAAMEAVQRVFGGRRCGSRKPRRPGGTGARAAGSGGSAGEVREPTGGGGETAQASSVGGGGTTGVSGGEDGGSGDVAEATDGSGGGPAVCDPGTTVDWGGNTRGGEVTGGADGSTAGTDDSGAAHDTANGSDGSGGGGGSDTSSGGSDSDGDGSTSGGHASGSGSAGASTSTSLYLPATPYHLKVLTLPGCIHLVVHVQGLAPPPPRPAGPPREPAAAPGGRGATVSLPVGTGADTAAAAATPTESQQQPEGGEEVAQRPAQAAVAAQLLGTAAGVAVQQPRRALVRRLARSLEDAVRGATWDWTTTVGPEEPPEDDVRPSEVTPEAAVGRPAGQPPPPPLLAQLAARLRPEYYSPSVQGAPHGAEVQPLLTPDLLPRLASSRVHHTSMGDESSPFRDLPGAPSGTANSTPRMTRGSSLIRPPSWILQEGPVAEWAAASMIPSGEPPHPPLDWGGDNTASHIHTDGGGEYGSTSMQRTTSRTSPEDMAAAAAKSSSVPAPPPPPTPHRFWTPSHMDSLASASHLGGTYSSVATTTTTTTVTRLQRQTSPLTSAGGCSSVPATGSSLMVEMYGITELRRPTSPYGTRLPPIPPTPTSGSSSTSTLQQTALSVLGPDVEGLDVTAAAAVAAAAAATATEQDHEVEGHEEEEEDNEEEESGGWFALLEPPVVALPGEGEQAESRGPQPSTLSSSSQSAGFATLLIFRDRPQPRQPPLSGEGACIPGPHGIHGASNAPARNGVPAAATAADAATAAADAATAAAPPVARVLVHQGGRVLVDQGVALPVPVPVAVESPPVEAPPGPVPVTVTPTGGADVLRRRSTQQGAAAGREHRRSTAEAGGLKPVAQLRLDLRMLHGGSASLLVLPPPPPPPPPSREPSPAAAAGAEPSLSYRARCQEALLSMPLLAVPPAVAAELRGLADSMAEELAAQMYDEVMEEKKKIMYGSGGDLTAAAAGGGDGSTGGIITAPDPNDPRVRSLVSRDYLGPLLADLTVLLQDRDQDQSYDKDDDSASGGRPGSSVRHHGGLSPAAVQQLRGHVLQYLRQAGMQATAAYLERP